MSAAAGQAAGRRATAHRGRQALLLGTALEAAGVLVLAVPPCSAQAQPAPDARPAGGAVVAGSATIRRTPGITAIDQSTPRAAVNWQSFDVGARQSVDFHQPSASAVTLNRVTGPNPSQIAGRITANGQVILQNQDGITFYKGAQVNTAGFLATAAGITDRNFMAGRMVFDQPAGPGARVENRGRITVRQAGLAALVAPQVENSGVITAKLGRVVLAGARTYALDLYGDGLIAIDVNGAVTQVPRGPDGAPVTALVTNTGTIAAAGGIIELTARQAAGVVQNLVTAGGTLAAPTLGARTGEIVLNGIGGSIVVAGQVLATGAAPGTQGGQIEIAPDGGVALAATARLDASGAAGGGVVAIGTTLDRARAGPGGPPARTAQTVTLARGARVAADATARGDGGRVAVLSAGTTVMDGTINARGGPQGGDGGRAEVSGRSLGFDGAVDLGAPVGNLGTILFDPGTLYVTDYGFGSLDTVLPTVPFTADGTTATDTVSTAAITAAGSSAAVILQAATLLDVLAPISVSNGLTLQSGGDLLIEASVSAGALTAAAGRNLTLGGGDFPATAGADASVVMAAGQSDPTGVLTLYGDVVSQTGGVFLSSGPGGMVIGSSVIANQSGQPVPLAGGLVSLRTDALSFVTGASLIARSGGIELAPATTGLAMTIGGSGPGLDIPTLPVTAANGGPGLRLGATTDPTSGTVTTTAGAITLAGPLYQGGFGGADLILDATGPVTQTAPVLAVGTLAGQADSLTLDQANTVGTLGAFVTAGGLALTDVGTLTVAGPLAAAWVTLQAGGAMTLAGDIGLPGSGGPVVLLQVTPGSGGAASFDQTGAVAVGGSVANGGTVTIALPSTGGSARLADLRAPGMQLVLSLGDGSATGTLAAGGLLVLGQGGSAGLFGTVGGNGTPQAASLAQILPRVDPAYSLNGCVIGAPPCGVSPSPPSPPPSPPPPPLPGPPGSAALLQAALTAPYGGLRQVIPGWLPPPPSLPTVDLAVIGAPPAAPDRLTGPDVAPPNISDLDY